MGDCKHEFMETRVVSDYFCRKCKELAKDLLAEKVLELETEIARLREQQALEDMAVARETKQLRG